MTHTFQFVNQDLRFSNIPRLSELSSGSLVPVQEECPNAVRIGAKIRILDDGQTFVDKRIRAAPEDPNQQTQRRNLADKPQEQVAMEFDEMNSSCTFGKKKKRKMGKRRLTP